VCVFVCVIRQPPSHVVSAELVTEHCFAHTAILEFLFIESRSYSCKSTNFWFNSHCNSAYKHSVPQ